jgi:acyl-coenzyme A synthetase/AMP-(fatty) acid ligase
MENHSVFIGASPDDLSIRFSDIFNVAVPFIDRHVAEGNGEKVAIRTTSAEEVTYAALAERV